MLKSNFDFCVIKYLICISKNWSAKVARREEERKRDIYIYIYMVPTIAEVEKENI